MNHHKIVQSVIHNHENCQRKKQFDTLMKIGIPVSFLKFLDWGTSPQASKTHIDCYIISSNCETGIKIDRKIHSATLINTGHVQL